ncbi:MAG: hypothetical protein ACRD8W_05565 [Nitrososphaeraceae archaeon]
MKADNLFVAGLIEGHNYPKGKFDKNNPFIDLDGCKDIIIVDRTFFLENIGLIRSWAAARAEEKTRI